MKEYVIEKEASAENIEKLSVSCENILRESGMPELLIQELLMAMDEAVTNIVMYGSESAADTIKIIIRISAEYTELELIDNGHEFDPTLKHDVDLNVPLEQRKVGGMGMKMMKQFTDSMRYYRKDSKNHFILTKRT